MKLSFRTEDPIPNSLIFEGLPLELVEYDATLCILIDLSERGLLSFTRYIRWEQERNEHLIVEFLNGLLE